MQAVVFLSIFAAVAVAELSPPLLQCPERKPGTPEWEILMSPHGRLCVQFNTLKKSFSDAHIECARNQGARLLSVHHQMPHLQEFMNLLDKDQTRRQNEWYVDRYGSQGMRGEDKPTAMEAKPYMKWVSSRTNSWNSVNEDGKWKIMTEGKNGATPRSFVCESQGVPVVQRPKFNVEPADTTIIKNYNEQSFARFSCQSFGNPKPELYWVMVKNNETHPGEFSSILINPIRVTTEKQMIELGANNKDSIVFLDMRVNCVKHPERCPDFIQESTLFVYNTQLFKDEFFLACAASNSFGQVLSRQAYVRHAIFKDFVEDEMKNPKVYEVEEGSSLRIPCGELEEYSPEKLVVDFFMKKNNKVMNIYEIQDTKALLSYSRANKEMIIDGATKKDAGIYMCVVNMPNGAQYQSYEREFQVRVIDRSIRNNNMKTKNEPAYILSGYPALFSGDYRLTNQIYEGDFMFIECFGTGKNEKIEWQFNEKDLPKHMQSRLELFRNMIKLNRVRLADSGRFRCRHSKKDQVSSWSSVEIRVLPRVKIVERTADLIVRRGEKATLTCRVEGGNVRVTPVKGRFSLRSVIENNHLYYDIERYAILEQTSDRIVFEISDFMDKDSYTYGCRAMSVTPNLIDIDFYYTAITLDSNL